MPSIGFSHQPQRQPYRIVLFGEKSSLAPALGPIRERVNGELLLPTGESTTTMVPALARRCEADGRPAVILYFADFDPAGWQMAISVARKLQALKALCFPTLDVRLYPIDTHPRRVGCPAHTRQPPIGRRASATWRGGRLGGFRFDPPGWVKGWAEWTKQRGPSDEFVSQSVTDRGTGNLGGRGG
jgi:hypothetical protein